MLPVRLSQAMAEEGRPPAGLILWEPILDFAAFHRRMRWINRLSSGEEGIDAFGWHFVPDCIDRLQPALSFNTDTDLAALGTDVLIGLISGAQKSMELKRIPSLERRIGRPHIIRCKAQPFWELIGQSEAHELIERTVQWLSSLRERRRDA